ncbi:AAA family ATPase [Kineococcus gynurae]|uniref:AAA family ATPase n=1 Tax=Kineococcus gynurae TaxID=452979 RepID=A0ABV5LTE3_9ACTN
MAPGRFDVTQLRLRNFRSIPACAVKLGALTFLVGPNGAGKSNVLDSLRLTAQSLNENLDNALRERGGVQEVRRRSTGHPRHFGISLDFQGPTCSGKYSFEVGAVGGGDFRVTKEDCSITPVAFGADPVSYRVRSGEVVHSSLGQLPRSTPDRLLLASASGLPAFREAFDGLAGMNVYNLNPEVMRPPQIPDPGELLRRDGGNIASVLTRLSRERPEVKADIDAYLAAVVPGIVAVERSPLGAYETLSFRQEVDGSDASWTFAATSMSDGTLRALGALAALFAGAAPVRSPVGIEEPEAALHPAASGTLLEALQVASETRQVLATSHSPDLLDSPTVGPESIVAVTSRRGETAVSRPDAAAASVLREGLFTAGELLRVDQLRPAEALQPDQLKLFAS